MYGRFVDLIALLLWRAKLCESFIRRNDCGNSAEFTIKNKDQYFTTETEDLCMLTCVGVDACFFVNYHEADKTCELVTSFIGTWGSNPGWTHFSTNYSLFLKRGKRCQNYHCSSGCIEACGIPRCNAIFYNAALDIKAIVSEIHVDSNAGDANDGEINLGTLNRCVICTPEDGMVYWKIVFDSEAMIEVIVIYAMQESALGYTLNVDNTPYATLTKEDAQHYPIGAEGTEVKIFKRPADSNMILCEVEVYCSSPDPNPKPYPYLFYY